MARKIDESKYAQLIEAISVGDAKMVDDLITYNQHFLLNKSDMMHIIQHKYKKIMEDIVTTLEVVIIDEEIISGCLENKWERIVEDLVLRKQFKPYCIVTDTCIIALIETLHSKHIVKILTNPQLDFYNENIGCMKYILKTDKVDILKVIVSSVKIKINFEWEDCLFLRIIIKGNSCKIVKFLCSKESGFKKTETMHKVMLEYNNKSAIMLTKLNY